MIAHVDVWLPRRDGTHRGLGAERHHAGTCGPRQDGGTVHPRRRRGDELIRLRWRDRIHADRFHRLRVLRGRADHVAECEGLAIGAVGRACVVRTSAHHRLPAPRSPSTFSEGFSASDGWICCDGRRQRALPKGTRVEVRESKCTLRLARLSGVPFTNRLVTKFDLPVVGWREQARKTRRHASWAIVP